jgi:Tol biopolymer transport system component
MVTDTLSPSSQPDERLDSWKEIAGYLNRDESTVQRWEKREGMPVHRHVHAKRGSVYAYRAELDAWWQGRRQQLEPKRADGAEIAPEPQPPVAPGHSERESRERRRRWWLGTAATLVLILVSLLSLRWLPRLWAPLPVATPALVRLTSTSGLNTDPALSPDGSLLAYASDRGGSGELDIWVQPIGEERPRRVTSEPGDELEPSFSPNSGRIAFAKGEAGGISIVETAGGDPRVLVAAARARTPRFSPDGQWVTYWTGLPVWVIPPAEYAGGEGTQGGQDRRGGGAAGATGALFVIPESGGSPRQLAPDFAHARYGTWAADGETILFLGERERDPGQSSLDWYIVGVEAGEPTRTGALEVLRRSGVKGLPIPGAWSADGVVVFATYDGGASNVWQLAVSPATGRVVGQPVRLTFGTAVERSPAISFSGRVVFTSITENVDVWRLPLDAKTGLATGAIERVTDNAARDQLMNVSDDGRTMAFISSRTGQHDAWSRDLHTGRDRQITYSSSRGVRVSPDGSVLAIGTGIAEKPGTVLVPTMGTSPPSPLCDGCVPGDWSPDGTRLVVLRGNPVRLVVRDLGSSREMELAAHPTWNLLQPRFSPDGRWIVFHTTNSPSLRQIYAVPAFSEAPVPVDAWIPIVPDFGVQPSWSPDGSAVYHFSLRDGAFCAWLQALDPRTKRPVGSPRAVRHFHQPRLRAAAAAGATNDVAAGYLYVTLTESAANIWMLDR